MTQTITKTLEKYDVGEPLPKTGNAEKPTFIVKHWHHKGVECTFYRTRQTHYCGYVRLPEVLIGKIRTKSTHDEIKGTINPDIEAHGGITYGPDADNWIGFDTAHAWDVNYDENGEPLPGHLNMMSVERNEGRNDMIEWDPVAMTEEVARIADQIADFAEEHGYDIEQ